MEYLFKLYPTDDLDGLAPYINGKIDEGYRLVSIDKLNKNKSQIQRYYLIAFERPE